MPGPSLPIPKGIDSIPSIEIPEQWNKEWFIRFLKTWLAPGDTRNAKAGPGITITGQGIQVATISATSGAASSPLTAITTINDTVTFTSGGVTLASQTSAAGAMWSVQAQGTFVSANSATARAAEVAVFWGSTQVGIIQPSVITSTAQTTPWNLQF